MTSNEPHADRKLEIKVNNEKSILLKDLAGNAVIGCRSTHALILRKGVMGTDKVVIVVKDGMVREVFGACPYKFDVEILDMDFNGADPDAENAAQDRLQTVRQYLSKIY